MKFYKIQAKCIEAFSEEPTLSSSICNEIKSEWENFRDIHTSTCGEACRRKYCLLDVKKPPWELIFNDKLKEFQLWLLNNGKCTKPVAGISEHMYKTEGEQARDSPGGTPDFLFDEPVTINDRKNKWIEVKNKLLIPGFTCHEQNRGCGDNEYGLLNMCTRAIIHVMSIRSQLKT